MDIETQSTIRERARLFIAQYGDYVNGQLPTTFLLSTEEAVSALVAFVSSEFTLISRDYINESKTGVNNVQN